MTETGPSTNVPPYVLPVAPGVQVTSLLTVDDQPAGNGVHMVGIPDGMGIQADDDHVVALMNHELRSTEARSTRMDRRAPSSAAT